jgi:hypothetical protein
MKYSREEQTQGYVVVCENCDFIRPIRIQEYDGMNCPECKLRHTLRIVEDLTEKEIFEYELEEMGLIHKALF